jgi:hypothetical protein
VIKLERGKHRKTNKFINYAKRKPVYLSFLAVLASGIGILTALNSYANSPLQSDGGMSSFAQAGQPPTIPSGGITGSPATLYPQQNSTDLPNVDTGGSSTAEYYDDEKVTLDGPGQDMSSPNAWLLHFDITTDSNGTTLKGDNGYEQITSNLIDPWISAVDGYQDTGGTTQSEFDTFLRNEVVQQKAIWGKSKLFDGGNTITTYNLPTLIQDAGGAFSGRYAGIGLTEGPTFYWTAAPQAKVNVPPQTISGAAGEKIYFNGEVGIQSYDANYHYEYVEVDGPNGTPIVPESAIHLQNTATSSHVVYQTPGDSTSPQMTEVNGGNNDPGSIAPRWHYWVNGTGEAGWGTGNVQQNQQDYIQLPSTLPDGVYTVKLWASDYYNRVTAAPATASFTVGSGGSGSGITLTASNTTPTVNTPVTLTATVQTPPPVGDTYQIILENLNGATLDGSKSEAYSSNNVNTFDDAANSSTPLSENFEAYLYDETTGQSTPSNIVTVTWSQTASPPPNGGLCPSPYDSDEQWVSNGNGNETFHWTYNVPYPRYNSKGDFVGCGDTTTPMSQYYPASVSGGEITALSYDPGSPTGGMWFPVPEQQWQAQNGPGTLWYQTQVQHNWDGSESANGGPNASQISGTYIVNGQTFHTYGPGEGNQPWAYARPGSGIGFRVLWQGSPHSLPTSNNPTVVFKMINPDGSSTTWSQKLIINGDTLYTEGDQMLGLNIPPNGGNDAQEYVSAWTQIPKTTNGLNGPELADWSLSGNAQTVFNQGARISATVTFGTQNAGTITTDEQNMVVLFSYPAWFMNQIHSVTIDGQTYVGTTPAKDGQQ